MMTALFKEPVGRSEADPGSGILSHFLGKLKGKTGPSILSYFFCQSTDSRLNNAVSVLKGLIYPLVIRREDLTRHVRKRYNNGGGSMSERSNGEAGYVEEVRQFALLVKGDVCRVGRICKEVRIRRAQDL
jgi:hypothetical protein